MSSRFAWLLPDQVNPDPLSETTKPKLGLATTLTHGAGASRGYGVGWRAARPFERASGTISTGNKETVFAAIRREATQAVGKKEVRRQLNRLVVPRDAVLRRGGRHKQGRASVGPVELVGE